MKETIEKQQVRAPKLAINLQSIESIEEKTSALNSTSRSHHGKTQVKPQISLTLKPSKDGHAAMNEYLGKPSPTNQATTKIG